MIASAPNGTILLAAALYQIVDASQEITFTILQETTLLQPMTSVL